MLTDTVDSLLKELPIQTRLPSDSRSSGLTGSETEVQTGASSPTSSHSTASNISRQQVSILALLVQKNKYGCANCREFKATRCK
jgi:hypothetical protein